MKKQQTILIADDEPSVREIIRRYLEKEGYHIVESESGPETLQRIYEETPDLLILDIMLPGLDGYTITRSLRNPVESQEVDNNTSIPIIMIPTKMRKPPSATANLLDH